MSDTQREATLELAAQFGTRHVGDDYEAFEFATDSLVRFVDVLRSEVAKDLHANHIADAGKMVEQAALAATRAEPIYQTKLVRENTWRDCSKECFEGNSKYPDRLDTRIVYAAPLTREAATVPSKGHGEEYDAFVADVLCVSYQSADDARDLGRQYVSCVNAGKWRHAPASLADDSQTAMLTAVQKPGKSAWGEPARNSVSKTSDDLTRFEAYMDEPCTPGSKVWRNAGAVDLMRQGWMLHASLAATLPRASDAPDRCYAPGCGKWDGNDSCTCQRTDATGVVKTGDASSVVRKPVRDCFTNPLFGVFERPLGISEGIPPLDLIRDEVFIHRRAVQPRDHCAGVIAAVWIRISGSVFAFSVNDDLIRRDFNLFMQGSHVRLHRELRGIVA